MLVLCFLRWVKWGERVYIEVKGGEKESEGHKGHFADTRDGCIYLCVGPVEEKESGTNGTVPSERASRRPGFLGMG